MSRLLATIGAACAVLMSACGGYSDLPLPLREQAALTIEAFTPFPNAASSAQIALQLPDDAAGPPVIVGHPASAALGYRVVSWAWGPCPGGPPPSDAAPRLCVAVFTATNAAPPAPLVLNVIAETRGDGRRFTVSGSEGAQ